MVVSDHHVSWIEKNHECQLMPDLECFLMLFKVELHQTKKSVHVNYISEGKNGISYLKYLNVII